MHPASRWYAETSIFFAQRVPADSVPHLSPPCERGVRRGGPRTAMRPCRVGIAVPLFHGSSTRPSLRMSPVSAPPPLTPPSQGGEKVSLAPQCDRATEIASSEVDPLRSLRPAFQQSSLAISCRLSWLGLRGVRLGGLGRGFHPFLAIGFDCGECGGVIPLEVALDVLRAEALDGVQEGLKQRAIVVLFRVDVAEHRPVEEARQVEGFEVERDVGGREDVLEGGLFVL